MKRRNDVGPEKWERTVAYGGLVLAVMIVLAAVAGLYVVPCRWWTWWSGSYPPGRCLAERR